MDGSFVFARWRQCAFPWVHNWRHLANTIELVRPSVNGQPESTIQTANRLFLHSSRQKVHILAMGCCSSKIAPCHGGSGPHLIHGSLRPPRVLNPNGILIVLAVFVRQPQCPYIYFTMGRTFPLKIAPSDGAYPIHGSLGQPEFTTQTAFRSVQPFLQGSLV